MRLEGKDQSQVHGLTGTGMHQREAERTSLYLQGAQLGRGLQSQFLEVRIKLRQGKTWPI